MKFAKALLRWLSNIAVALLLICAVLLVGVRAVGLMPYAVLSGSMEPAYPVGSLIYVKKIDPADVRVGMPLTFVVNEEQLMATHRVVNIEKVTLREEAVLDEQGNPALDESGNPIMRNVLLDEPVYYFTTQGNANDTVDGTPVYCKNVVGTPVFSIPYLGYFAGWLQTRRGMIAGVSAALAVMLATLIPAIFSSGSEEQEEKRRRVQGESERRMRS